MNFTTLLRFFFSHYDALANSGEMINIFSAVEDQMNEISGASIQIMKKQLFRKFTVLL